MCISPIAAPLDRRLFQTLKVLDLLKKRQKEKSGGKRHGAPLYLTERTQIPCNGLPNEDLPTSRSQFGRRKTPYLVD